jgi:adenine deaminase
MGYDWEKDLIHIPFGLVSLAEGTLSTRSGRVVLMNDILNESVKRILQRIEEKNPNNFNRSTIKKEDIQNLVKDEILAIGVNRGQLWTDKHYFPVAKASNFESDIHRDILKIVYLNRYIEKSTPQIAYIHGIGLKEGAFASSIAHDSHNILAVGTSDKEITAVINEIIEHKGGLVVSNKGGLHTLPLPIAGIMSDKDAVYVAEEYENLNYLLTQQGCELESPFMTLAFMSLIVIPELKLGENGLFDYSTFSFINEIHAG